MQRARKAEVDNQECRNHVRNSSYDVKRKEWYDDEAITTPHSIDTNQKNDCETGAKSKHWIKRNGTGGSRVLQRWTVVPSTERTKEDMDT